MESARGELDNSERDERLFDEFLELALQAQPPDVDAFLAARGGAGAQLRERLHALQRTGARAPRADEGGLPFAELGEYRLIERIGRGGMGLVFLAEQPSLERKVALKILRPELAGSNHAAERLKREARAVAKLRHPGIVAVHGFGEERGVRYLAMEYVPGRTLEEELALGPIALARKLAWIRDLARALDYAHREGVVHRDMKPSNVRITTQDRAMLLDFGLVRSLDSDAATLTDSFAGSPAYAAPEQITSSASIDARSDVYSLGVTLYRCLTGVTPFDGATVERVFHQILTAEPTPPRRLVPTLPRDLEIVTLKAMERDPARRYATAGHFADDLDALLELRPIRARPLNLVERAARSVRRNRVAAAIAGSGLAALLAFGAWSVVTARAERERRKEAAVAALSAARDAVAHYRESRERFAALAREVEQLRSSLDYAWLAPEQYRLLDEREREVAALRRSWEATFHEVLEQLRAAERIDPSVAGTERVRAELYREKFREALAELDDDEAELYRGLVEQHDEGGELSAELRASSRVAFVSEPPGARVQLHRYVELSKLQPGGDPRTVPAPFRGESALPTPGTLCLRVARSAGELRQGDLIVELLGRDIAGAAWVAQAPREGQLQQLDRLVSVDGAPISDGWDIDFLAIDAAREPDGVARVRTFAFERAGATFEVRATTLDELGARVLTSQELGDFVDRPPLPCRVARDGVLLDTLLPPGAVVRATAAPLCHDPAAELGRAPLAPLELALGDYVAVFTLPGFEPALRPFSARGGDVRVEARLWNTSEALPGFVFVPYGAGDFWIQEHEVTSAEYLEFLNLDATLREVAAAPQLIRVPRQGAGAGVAPMWERGVDGRFVLPRGWAPLVPVVGISWHDAVAFARWRTEREQARGGVFEFELPDYGEYQAAGLCGTRRTYTWGTHFRPKWSRSCFARPRAGVGPVMQFPIDESPLGAYDFCGSAMEWLDAWYDFGRGMRRLGGGSWGQSMGHVLTVTGGLGAPPDATSGETGMRLLARRVGGGPR
jgi:hypothetical protein